MIKIAKKSKWIEWIKCNVLEIIILILVLLLVIKTFSGTPAEIGETATEPGMDQETTRAVVEKLPGGEPVGKNVTQEITGAVIAEPKESLGGPGKELQEVTAAMVELPAEEPSAGEQPVQ